MHQIPVDTIIVYIKTNTIAIKSLHFLLFWERFYCYFCVFFFSAGNIIMVLLLLQNYRIIKVSHVSLADLFIFKNLGF